MIPIFFPNISLMHELVDMSSLVTHLVERVIVFMILVHKNFFPLEMWFFHKNIFLFSTSLFENQDDTIVLPTPSLYGLKQVSRSFLLAVLFSIYKNFFTNLYMVSNKCLEAGSVSFHLLYRILVSFNPNQIILCLHKHVVIISLLYYYILMI